MTFEQQTVYIVLMIVCFIAGGMLVHWFNLTRYDLLKREHDYMVSLVHGVLVEKYMNFIDPLYDVNPPADKEWRLHHLMEEGLQEIAKDHSDNQLANILFDQKYGRL